MQVHSQKKAETKIYPSSPYINCAVFFDPMAKI